MPIDMAFALCQTKYVFCLPDFIPWKAEGQACLHVAHSNLRSWILFSASFILFLPFINIPFSFSPRLGPPLVELQREARVRPRGEVHDLIHDPGPLGRGGGEHKQVQGQVRQHDGE